MKYGNKPFYERVAGSPLALIAVIILLAFLAKAAWNIHAKASTTSQKLSESQIELAKLKDSQQDLTAKVSYLSTDQGIEAEMRTKFKAVKEGESVAVIVDTDQKAAAAEATSTASVGWWRRMLRFFGL
jgi:cell division protein FtsB